MGVLTGFDADVLVTGLPSVSIGGTPESCTNTDSGVYKRFRAATHHYWDKYQTLTVQTSPNGSSGWADATGYTFEYPGGYVEFATARTAGVNNFVRISAGYYLPSARLADCHSWQLDMKANVIDVSVFQGNEWGASQAAMKTVTGKIESFISDGTLDSVLADPMIFILYLDKSANVRYECYGYLTGLSPKSSMAGVVEKGIDFAVDGKVYYRTTA